MVLDMGLNFDYHKYLKVLFIYTIKSDVNVTNYNSYKLKFMSQLSPLTDKDTKVC